MSGFRVLIVMLSFALAAGAIHALPAPVWIEPTPEVEQNSYDFHIQVHEIEEATGTDFEIHDADTGELVWHTSIGDEAPHVHNGDGTFVGSLEGADRLIPGHDYTIRARFTGAEIGPWNETSFRTEPEVTYTESPLDWTPADGYVVETIAEGLSFPVSIRPAPDIYSGPDAPRLYVTELYGSIKVITESGEVRTFASDLLNYAPFDSFPGAGESGVTGLWVDDDGTVWATMTYAEDDGLYGKLVRFEPSADGLSAVSQEDVFTGVPAASSHQIQMVTRGPDGKIYINTGDANDLETTKDWSSLSGKVLRINDDGTIPDDNPTGSAVWVAGLRNPFGAAWDGASLLITQNGPDRNDGIFRLSGGETLGWCCDMTQGAEHSWTRTVAPTQIQIDDGSSGFPTAGATYVALSGPTYSHGPSDRAKRIVRFVENDGHEQLEDFVTFTGDGWSAPVGLAFDDDGLYFTDLYGEEGIDAFGVSSGSVLRVRYVGDVALETPIDFHIEPYFPQGLAVSLSCSVADEGNYRYTYDFGNGYTETIYKGDFVYHEYDEAGTYETSCEVTNLDTGASGTESLTVTVDGTSGSGDSGGDGNTSGGGSGDGGSDGGSGNTSDGGNISVALSMGEWFPQGLAVALHCSSNASSADYTYDFGDGWVETISEDSFVYHEYEAEGSYTASCTVREHGTGATGSSTMDIALGTSDGSSGDNTSDGGSDGGDTSGDDGDSNGTSSGDFPIELSMGEWFPQGNAVALHCSADRADATYTYDFGNGYVETIDEDSFVYYEYPSAGTYTGTCTVTDRSTGETASASIEYTVG